MTDEINTLEDFEQACARHDLTYSYSDDGRWWRAGCASHDRIRKAAEKFQESGSSSDEKDFQSARQAYQSHLGRYESAQKRYEARTQERGRLVDTWDSQMPSDNIFGEQPFDPTSENAPPNPDGFVVDKFPKPPGGQPKPTKPGGLPDHDGL